MKVYYGLLAGVLALAGCNQAPQTAPEKAPEKASESTSETKPETTEAKSETGTTQVRIATESNYKPFSYLDNQGNHQGFEIDLIHALCGEMKADCTISSQDWDSLIPGLTANKYDAVFASMSATDERRKVVNFSDPYFNNKLVLVGKKDIQATIDDVDGKNVAVQQATVSASYLADNHPKAVVKTYDKQDNAYLDLSAGRADFMLSDIVPMLDWLKTEQGADFEIKGEPIDIDDKVAVAIKKGDTVTLDKFNTTLASLKQTGEYDKIVAKYFESSAITMANSKSN